MDRCASGHDWEIVLRNHIPAMVMCSVCGESYRVTGNMTDEIPWWWLSFCDPDRPEGQQFIGVAIVCGWTIQEAVTRSHLLKVNPGGEISFAQMPPERVPRPEFCNCLMDYAELAASGLLE
jgi:hypothetical protein